MTDDQLLLALAEKRRKEATRAVLKYGLVSFFCVAVISCLIIFVVWDASSRAADRRDRIAQYNATRTELCVEIEKLKAQNRAEVAISKKQYKRNLSLLHIKDSPELRKAAEESWARTLRLNAPKKCPYTTGAVLHNN